MVQLELTPTTLIIHVQGMDRLWSLASRLEIPLAHIDGATIDPQIAQSGPQGLRLPGTHLPGVIAAGSFLQAGEWVFWDVHRPENAIVLYLHDDRYAGLVVEVEDPEAAVAAITRAVRAYRTPD